MRAEISDTDLAKVAVGQRVDVSVDALPGEALTGKVVGLPSGLAAQPGAPPGRGIQIAVEWPRAGAQLGMLARGQIVVQEKSGALVVPLRAVKTVGKRRFVEYLDGQARRGQNVEVGITTDTEAEILSVPGIVGAARVYRGTATERLGSGARELDLLEIDAFEMLDVAYWRPHHHSAGQNPTGR